MCEEDNEMARIVDKWASRYHNLNDVHTALLRKFNELLGEHDKLKRELDAARKAYEELRRGEVRHEVIKGLEAQIVVITKERDNLAAELNERDLT